VAAEVDIALLELRAARAQQEIAAERRRLAEEELRQARERFSAGVVGNIEVIDAQVSLLSARDTEIEARFVAAAARVALARAVGMVGGLQ
jgi:outer membrane protein TolC